MLYFFIMIPLFSQKSSEGRAEFSYVRARRKFCSVLFRTADCFRGYFTIKIRTFGFTVFFLCLRIINGKELEIVKNYVMIVSEIKLVLT